MFALSACVETSRRYLLCVATWFATGLQRDPHHLFPDQANRVAPIFVRVAGGGMGRAGGQPRVEAIVAAGPDTGRT